MMAHIRYATQGTVSLANVHPFSRELWGVQWCFAHNGEVPKCSSGNNLNREKLLLGRTNPRDSFYHPVGDTDSEAVFCAILNALRAEFTVLPTLPVLYEALQRFCAEIVSGEEESTILNFLIGCGQYTMFAYSWPGARPGSKVWNGLYYTIRRPPFASAKLADVDYSVDFSRVTNSTDRVAVIATAPLTVNEEWNEFKRGQLLMFNHGWGYSELYDCHEVEKEGRGLSSKAIPKAPCIEGLSYDTPALLRKLVDEVISDTKRGTVWARRGADLGCGSGGAGQAFRSCIQNLTGVDISPEMVDKARQRGCYDRLLVGDIKCVLCKSDLSTTAATTTTTTTTDCAEQSLGDDKFDVIFASNVFSFIDDIRGVFESVRNFLTPVSGVFAFSAELIEGKKKQDETEEEDERLVLQSCARYAHDRKYVIERLTAELGFEIKAMKTSELRQHAGRMVQGVVVVMTLTS